MTKRPRSTARAPETTTTEVVRTDDRLDTRLVDEGVAWIRSKLAETLFRGMSEIGAYVLDRFFGGDPERARSKHPTKNASFRSLVKRCESTELPISRSALQRAVWVAVMLRALPEGATAYPRLPPAHQVALLPLRVPATIEKVAESALSKRLSVRDLRDVVGKEVAKAAPDGERRGPKPRPLILKALDGSLRLFTLESGKRSFTKAQVDELDERQTKQALKSAQALAERLRKLMTRLEDRG